MDIILVDPAEDIFNLLNTRIILQNWDIKLSETETSSSMLATKLYELLDTVIITKISSIPSLLTLLLCPFERNVNKNIKVIVLNPETENLILETAYRFLFLNESIVR